MDREIVLAFLIASTVAPLLGLATVFTRPPTPCACAWRWERRCWRRLWLPFLPAAVFLSLLLGWALREPEQAEPVPALVAVLAVPPLVVAIRALARRLVAQRRGGRPIAGTVGLLRPRIILDEQLNDFLDPAQKAAVYGHEAAHLRHRDPLRIFLAHLATDLQWPLRPATRRLDQWLHALEAARDEEARLRGIDGADLASAILVATRLKTDDERFTASLATEAELPQRLRRLLDPISHNLHRSPGLVLRLGLSSVLLASLAVGVVRGEAIVRLLLLP